MMDHVSMLEDTIKDLESTLFDPAVESALMHYAKINTRAQTPQEILRKIKILKAASKVRPKRSK